MNFVNKVVALAFLVGDKYIESNSIAEIMHYAAVNKGWKSVREYPAPTSGRKGRIDLLLSDGKETVAIEVDAKVVKTKSVKKLSSLHEVFRMCIISDGSIQKTAQELGVEMVVSIKDRTVSSVRNFYRMD